MDMYHDEFFYIYGYDCMSKEIEDCKPLTKKEFSTKQQAIEYSRKIKQITLVYSLVRNRATGKIVSTKFADINWKA